MLQNADVEHKGTSVQVECDLGKVEGGAAAIPCPAPPPFPAPPLGPPPGAVPHPVVARAQLQAVKLFFRTRLSPGWTRRSDALGLIRGGESEFRWLGTSLGWLKRALQSTIREAVAGGGEEDDNKEKGEEGEKGEKGDQGERGPQGSRENQDQKAQLVRRGRRARRARRARKGRQARRGTRAPTRAEQ